MKSPYDTQLTCGSYQYEAEACAIFDQTVEESGLFGVHKEVGGVFVQPPHFKNYRGKLRLDRLLIPKRKLMDSGWTGGAIGVEIKRSGTKIGPPLSQMLDYMRVALVPPFGVKLLLDYCFLFPADKTHNEVASIMAQNRIGTACIKYPPHNEHHRLQFFCGEQSRLIYYIKQDRLEIGNLSFGKKAGSR